MIPYDDLVAALATWRARQGLPVAQLAGVVPPPPSRAPAPPPAARTAPPSAPPRTAAPSRTTAPVPAQISSELDDFDDGEGALLEIGHDDGGDDYAAPFGGAAVDQAGEATAIGGAPEPPSEGLLVPRRGKRDPDW